MTNQTFTDQVTDQDARSRNFTGKLKRNGTETWYKDGLFHRDDGPALIRPDGSKYWYLDGKSHREDGPAIELAGGSKSWWLNDKLIAKGERPENWDELVLLAQVEQMMND